MEQFKDELGRGALADAEWQAINGVSTFLRGPRQVMERLSTDRKPTIDLMTTSISLLVKHCENSEETLLEIQGNLTTVDMKDKLNQYKRKLVQEPAIIAAFLIPQFPKPTDLAEHKRVVDLVRSMLQRRYSANLNLSLIIETESSSSSLFASMFQPVCYDGSTGDEIEKYLSIGAFKSSGFIDVLSWWSARKDLLPVLYHMAVVYCRTPATSTPSKRVNNAAGRKFTCTRQPLWSSVFIMTLCMRSWIGAGIFKVPANRARAAARLVQSGANDV